jgi:hypothetical protein
MTNQEYNKILHHSRRRELTLKTTTLNNIIALLSSVSNDLENAIARAADQNGTLRKEQLQQVKARIDEDLDIFQDQYQKVAHAGIVEEVNLIIERNGEIFIEAEGTRKLIDLLHDKVLTQVLEYKEKDGLILSDRIWKMSVEAKSDITNRLTQGILLGESHVKVAKDIRQYIVGNGGLRYKSERLAMTEMAKAYKKANEQSVQMMRENSQFMWYEKWELSPAHKEPDVCDLLATQDEGEGQGIYQNAPNRHPGCYCYIYPVFRPKRGTATYPSVSPMIPHTENLDKSQHKLAKELTQ